jgi:hypothetical protein
MTDRELPASTAALLLLMTLLAILVLFWLAFVHPGVVIAIVVASALGGGAYWKARL